MDVKVTKQGNCGKIVDVEVPANELTPHFDNSYKKFQKKLKLEGFRQGKVPISLIKNLYGDAIRKEAIEDVVQSVFREVTEQENLRLTSPAKLDDVQFDPENGLQFKATVEVIPEIELKNYTGLVVEKEVYQIDDEDIATALEEVREKMAVMEPVENEAQENHHLVADFQEVDSAGLPIVGKKYDNRVVVLDMETNKELTEQLIGVKPDEKRHVVFTQVTQDDKPPKNEHYEVFVKEIKSKWLPELDDELAKDVGEFQTLQELKDDISEKLKRQIEVNSRNSMRRSLIDELLKKNSFNLPESMISNYLEAIIKNSKNNSNQDINEEELRQHYRPSAIWQIKWQLALEKLQELENLSVTEEDKAAFITKLSKERGISEKKIKKSLMKQSSRNQFDDDILHEKVLDFLENNAKIKEKKVTRKDLEKASRVSL